MTSIKRLVLASVLVVSCVLGYAVDTRACGLFVPHLAAKAVPRLERERVLILWDKASKREHFVREVRFNNSGDQSFGFVVPVPSRPEVHDVKSSPFDTLESRFGHTLLETAVSADREGAVGAAPGSGFGRGAGAAAPVRVVEKKRVGDFTSFTLEASDANALAQWLKKNQFRISSDGQKWASRYVELGYFFVALRFDGKKRKADEGDAIVSRTLRLSFDTPLPFYPYAEPSDVPEQPGRELAVWFVSDALMLPIAGMEAGSGLELRRPWSEGARHEPAAVDLSAALGPDLSALPHRDARVQTFGDWKENRRGFGDLVLVPAHAEGCDASCVRARRPLLALLDPALRSSKASSDAELVIPAPTPARAGLAPIGRTDDRGDWGLGSFVVLSSVLVAVGLRRRSSRKIALGMLGVVVGCGGAPPPPAPAPPSSASVAGSANNGPLVIAEGGEETPPAKIEAFTLPSQPAEREKSLMRVLAGHHGERFIPTWSTPFARGIGRARNAFLAGVDVDAIGRRCIQDDRIEAIVTYALEPAPGGATIKRARVDGPLPPSVLGCIQGRLRSEIRSPSGMAPNGWLSFGPISPEAILLRERIASSAFTNVPIAAPNVSVRETSTTVSGGLPKEVVRRILRSQLGRFRLCYEQNTHPAPKGNVTLRFSIGPNGNVTQMAASTADVAARTGVCLGDAIRNTPFPRTQGVAIVNVVTTLAFERNPAGK